MDCKENCPIEKTVSLIGKKWSLNIIRDIFLGKNKFSEFLKTNNELSTKMLSARLKELQENKIISKKITSKTPITVEYHLTERGKKLNKIIYELACFSIEDCEDKFCKNKSKKEVMKELKKMVGI